MNLGLQGRVVLVTGGVRGVGAGISAVFAGQGAIVVTCARRPVEGLPFEFHGCDVRDPDAVAVLIETIVAEHGRLDVVVNNAGGSPYALAADASPRFHQKIVELNLLGMLHVSQAANAVMQRQDQGGSIISISSISGSRPSPGTEAAHPHAVREYREQERRDKADTAIVQAARRRARAQLRKGK